MFVFLTEYYSDVQQKNEMGQAHDTMRERCLQDLVGNPEETRSLRRQWRRWERNIKLDVNETGRGEKTGLIRLRIQTSPGIL